METKRNFYLNETPTRYPRPADKMANAFFTLTSLKYDGFAMEWMNEWVNEQRGICGDEYTSRTRVLSIRMIMS